MEYKGNGVASLMELNELLSKVQEELGVSIPNIYEGGVFYHSGPKTIESVESKMLRKQNDRPSTLESIPDLGRGAYVAGDGGFPELIDITKKTAEQVQVAGHFTENPNSKYLNVNLNMITDGIPTEMQLFVSNMTFYAKKIADECYKKSRHYKLITDQMSALGSPDKMKKHDREMYNNASAQRTYYEGLERKIHEMVRRVVKLEQNQDQLKQIYKITKRELGQSLRNKSPHKKLLRQNFSDGFGGINRTALKKVYSQLEKPINESQDKLCKIAEKSGAIKSEFIQCK